MSPYVQSASITTWRDEEHDRTNREQYRKKFDAVQEILQPIMNDYNPEAGIYLWPETPGNDIEFTRVLLEKENVTVLPGSFISREADGVNPGSGHVCVALAASVDDCAD